MPNQNGEVERFNRTLKRHNQAAHLEGKDWRNELQSFLLAYRTTPHTVTGESPATIMFGRQIRNDIPSMPVESKRSSIDLNDQQRKTNMKQFADKHNRAKLSSIKVGDQVLIKNTSPANKLSTPWLQDLYTVERIYARSATVVNDRTRKRYHRAKAHIKRVYRAGQRDPGEGELRPGGLGRQVPRHLDQDEEEELSDTDLDVGIFLPAKSDPSQPARLPFLPNEVSRADKESRGIQSTRRSTRPHRPPERYGAYIS